VTSPAVRIARAVVVVVAALFFVGAAFALTVGFTLLVPGTAVDRIWAMKAGSRAPFEAIGAWGIVLMALLAGVLVVASVGLLRRWRWARWFAVLLLAVNVVPDIVRGFTVEPAVLIPIIPVAAVMVYLALPVVGRSFRRPSGRTVGEN
jgi:hypothetical protein